MDNRWYAMQFSFEIESGEIHCTMHVEKVADKIAST